MKENSIEKQILDFLTIQEVFCYKITKSGYFDPKTKSLRKHTSVYAINGNSDITGIMPDGIRLDIEVKTPETIKLYFKEYEYLEKKYQEALAENTEKSKARKKKYKHAIEQKQYIDNIVNNKGVAFFASSIEDVVNNLLKFGYSVS